jgi:ATP-binding cassette subfamily C (CFTR/MRP) protein 1
MTIDDILLHKLDRQTLRERIVAVPQDAVFLPDGSSVMANLDPLNTSNEAECRAVLETVGVWKFMEERGGLNEEFSADTLSQGQKQLFSLARAVLKRRIRERDYEVDFGVTTSVQGRGGILLLDEVSSSVDQDTDRAMQTVIKEEFESYTIIMVSHRLEIVMDFDTVVVMEKGGVVESRNPRTLVDTNGSRFKESWLAGNKS